MGARSPSPQAPPAEGQRSRCVAWWVALAAHAPRPRRLREGQRASRRARSFGGAEAAWEAGCGLKGRLAWVAAPQLALWMGRQCQAVNVQVGQVIAAVPARTCRNRLGVPRVEQSPARAPGGAVAPTGRVEPVRPGGLTARRPRGTKGLRPPEQVERPAGFPSSDKTTLSCPNFYNLPKPVPMSPPPSSFPRPPARRQPRLPDHPQWQI